MCVDIAFLILKCISVLTYQKYYQEIIDVLSQLSVISVAGWLESRRRADVTKSDIKRSR